MTIAARIEDAVALMELERWEGALLSTLVAMAGTVRLRFPEGTKSETRPGKLMGDGEAFERFVSEELPRVADVATFNVTFQGKIRPLGEILYKWLRCSLAHEAMLPPEIGFVPDSARGRIEIGHHSGPPETIVFTHSLVVLLADVVLRAQENTAIPGALRDRVMKFVL